MLKANVFLPLLSLLAAGWPLVGCGGAGDPGAGPANGDGSIGADAGGDRDGGTTPECRRDSPDPIDLDGTDSNCDGVDGVASQQVYVSPDGQDDRAGTPDRPVRSLARAFEIAQGRAIMLAQGTYEATTDLVAWGDDELRLYGGRAPETGWAETDQSSVINVPHSGFQLPGLNGGALFRRVVIQAADAPSDALGSSSLALVVSAGVGAGAVLRLENSLVLAGNAAGGAAGRVGEEVGTAGVAGTPGEGCHFAANGQCDVSQRPRASIAPEPPSCGGPRSRAGSGSVVGSFGGGEAGGTGAAGGQAGTLESPNGKDGRAGPDGAPGTDGFYCASLGTFGPGGYEPPFGEGGEVGQSGGGGGGGGSGNGFPNEELCGAICLDQYTGAEHEQRAACLAALLDDDSCRPDATERLTFGASGGSGGTGGCGGQGGHGGQGGGASAALVVENVEVVLVESELRGGLGGAGGAGGPGADGGVGGAGGGRGLPVRSRYHSSNSFLTGRYNVAFSRNHQGGGGGRGGRGGRGGYGAGGTGGPSFGVVLLGEGVVDYDQLSEINAGRGGLGALTDGHSAADGLAQGILRVP